MSKPVQEQQDRSQRPNWSVVLGSHQLCQRRPFLRNDHVAVQCTFARRLVCEYVRSQFLVREALRDPWLTERSSACCVQDGGSPISEVIVPEGSGRALRASTCVICACSQLFCHTLHPKYVRALRSHLQCYRGTCRVSDEVQVNVPERVRLIRKCS